MLSNHLRNTHNNYYTSSSTIHSSSHAKIQTSQNFENQQDKKQNNKEQNFYKKEKILSTREKVQELDRIVNSPSIMSAQILKSKLANISSY